MSGTGARPEGTIDLSTLLQSVNRSMAEASECATTTLQEAAKQAESVLGGLSAERNDSIAAAITRTNEVLAATTELTGMVLAGMATVNVPPVAEPTAGAGAAGGQGEPGTTVIEGESEVVGGRDA
ncbi:MAG: hypothetical protein AAF533_05840 [Acidobacteriota bacterium]